MGMMKLKTTDGDTIKFNPDDLNKLRQEGTITVVTIGTPDGTVQYRISEHVLDFMERVNNA